MFADTFFSLALPLSAPLSVDDKQKVKLDLTTTEPFSDTFGSKAQRKRPRLEVGSFSELADQIKVNNDAKAAAQQLAADDKAIEASWDVDDSVAPVEDDSHDGRDRPMDYILSAGTSRRIWAELYKVCCGP